MNLIDIFDGERIFEDSLYLIKIDPMVGENFFSLCKISTYLHYK